MWGLRAQSGAGVGSSPFPPKFCHNGLRSTTRANSGVKHGSTTHCSKGACYVVKWSLTTVTCWSHVILIKLVVCDVKTLYHAKIVTFITEHVAIFC